MSFEWDPNKAAANIRKHGVQFSEAVGVFSDGYAITIDDDESDPDEQRFVTLGMGIKGRILDHLSSHGQPVEREQYEAHR